ncbi:MAG: hypothetical protein ACXWLF_02560 [Myxococcaceae bacterium]
MRTAISGMAVVGAGLMAGACFDPTRPCSTSADCVSGGTCDPGTRTCVSAGNPNDKTPPTFSLVVAAPSPRQNTTKLTELDPASPDGGIDAFRRDETVTVTVSSKDQDVDGGSVKLQVFGIATGPVPPADVPLVPCPAGSPGASDPFCRQATVLLAALPFEAFRGVVVVVASGSDLSNNLGTADAGVNVTRWKWRYSAGAPIHTTPAIADDGTIVFGTSDGGSGSLYALTPAGEEKWAPVALGPIKASPVIGTRDGGQQLAYLATASTDGKLFAFDLASGTSLASCPPGPSSYAGPFLGTPALVISGSGQFEGALALASGSKLVNVRPRATGAESTCITTDTPATQAFASNTVALGVFAYLATAEGLVRAFTLDSGNWVKNSAWGGGLGYAGVGDRAIQSVALAASEIVGTTSLRGVFALAQTTGVLDGAFPSGGLSSDPGGLIISPDQVFFGSGIAASPILYSTSISLETGKTQAIPSPLVGTPAAGKGGLIYFGTTEGTLEARTGLAAPVWSNPFGVGEAMLGSPTISCGVGNSPFVGVLYSPSTSGNLFSVIVDSPGLDPTAPWPKYQHDVRNTGNPTTPIQSCP